MRRAAGPWAQDRPQFQFAGRGGGGAHSKFECPSYLRISLRDLPATTQTHTRFAARLLALWGSRTAVFETGQPFETSYHHSSFHLPGSLKSVPFNNPKKPGSKSKKRSSCAELLRRGHLEFITPRALQGLFKMYRLTCT